MALNEKKKSTHPLRVIGGIIIVIALIALFNSGSDEEDSSNNKSSNSQKSAYDPNPRLAYNVCKDLIKDQLKSPGSAEFPGLFESKDHVQYIGDRKYKINSWVDSQNSFGAMVRTKFTCTMVDKGDTYEMHDLQVFE